MQKKLSLIVFCTLFTACSIWSNDPADEITKAIQEGYIDRVEYLIQQYGQNPNSFVDSDNHNTPLHTAVLAGNTKIVAYLLTTVFGGVEWIESQNSDRHTPLHCVFKVSEAAALAITEQLLLHGCNVNLLSEKTSLLWKVCNEEKPELARFLVRCGAVDYNKNNQENRKVIRNEMLCAGKELISLDTEISLLERFQKEFKPTISEILLRQATFFNFFTIPVNFRLKTFSLQKKQKSFTSIDTDLDMFLKDIEQLAVLLVAGFKSKSLKNFIGRLSIEDALILLHALGSQNFTHNLIKKIDNTHFCDARFKFGGPSEKIILSKNKHYENKTKGCNFQYWTKCKKTKKGE